jgi:hypothetical protein
MREQVINAKIPMPALVETKQYPWLQMKPELRNGSRGLKVDYPHAMQNGKTHYAA